MRESVRACAFFCDDQRPANVAAGSDGIGKLRVRPVAVEERANAGLFGTIGYGGRTEKVFVFVLEFDLKVKVETESLKRSKKLTKLKSR